MSETEYGPDATARFLPGYPAFVNEIVGTLAVHSQYVLHGNLRDEFLLEPLGREARFQEFLPLLWEATRQRGYECLIRFDPVDGITVYPDEERAAQAARTLLGHRAVGRRPALDRLRAHLANVVGAPPQPPLEGEHGARTTAAGTVGTGTEQDAAAQLAPPRPKPFAPPVRAAFVIEYAARLTRVPGQLDQAERDFFLYCHKLALTARAFSVHGHADRLYNPVFYLVEGERDLPAWLTAGTERIRTIAVGTPTLGERTKRARMLVPQLPAPASPTPDVLAKAEQEFAKRTDGMTVRSMTEIARLSKDRGITADHVADAVRIYKLGVDDNPWRQDAVHEQILEGQKTIEDRVIGQDRAVRKTLDILKRAALGLSGAQATSTATRPRGVLFFAGPTGVGKTELAKQVAQLLFGDTDSYLRFDMSEFAAEHAADRLIGAPPGYVGFEAGGELTGAVRRNPFQVVLFDEIEKAHPLVLDKFLQILEDGRLTDGQGVTTYFSECVLVFTSNLGISTLNPKTNERTYLVQPGEDYDVVEKKVREAVQDHFTTQLGRPELLNRLGDNIVVFNFINADVAGRICELQLGNIVDAVERELEISLEFTEGTRRKLIGQCTEDLANGGRGIGNRLESLLINPLARQLFDENAPRGSRVEVTAVTPELEVRIAPGGDR